MADLMASIAYQIVPMTKQATDVRISRHAARVHHLYHSPLPERDQLMVSMTMLRIVLNTIQAVVMMSCIIRVGC